MKYIKTFNESRDIKSRELITFGNIICNFLNKIGYNYTDINNDSGVYASFKLDNFTSIIPPIKLGGIAYPTTQGYYCYDMNIFKESLFGKLDIIPENCKLENITKSTNEIPHLGLGYANDGAPDYDYNSLIRIRSSFTIPRYLNIIKLKSNAVILSSNTSDEIVNTYFIKFINLKYGTNFTDTNEIKYFFNKNIKLASDLIKKYLSKKNNMYVHLYKFIIAYIKLSYRKRNPYIKANLEFNLIGIDGFTQRSPNDFIHKNPPNQTVIFNSKCIETKLLIDLKESLNNDKYIILNKNYHFLKKLNIGDYYKANNRLFTFNGNIMECNTDEYIIEPADINIEFMDIINNLKPGYYIKIIQYILTNNNRIEYMDIIIKIIDIKNDKYKIKIGHKNEYIKGKVDIKKNRGKTIETFYYNHETSLNNLLLFNPYTFNDPIYHYWNYNELKIDLRSFYAEQFERYLIYNTIDDVLTGSENDISKINLFNDLIQFYNTNRNILIYNYTQSPLPYLVVKK